jgi:TPR repeat protein
MYANGKGTSKDAKQAVYWYQKAAAQENTTSGVIPCPKLKI